jgi:Tol biopolymer transport system component/DNA-binding winged helix-turn-helix (wHTH) protein
LIEEPRQLYEFEEFRLDVTRRQLLRNGEVVPIYSKAFDLLLLLVENRGRDLGKEEILDRIWPGQELEESNLTVNISAVRRALGEKAAQPRFLVTIPGRGYRFVASVREPSSETPQFVIASETISEIIVEEESDEDEANEKTLLSRGSGTQLISGATRATRRPVVIAAGLAGIVLLAGIATGVYLWLHRASAFPFQQISIKRLTTKGNVSLAAMSPDGKLFVYAVPDGEKEGLWLGHVEGGEPVQIREPADNTFLQLRFSPDGSHVYFLVRDASPKLVLYRMPVFGGAPEKLVENLGGLTFGPDGSRVAFLRFDRTRKQSLLLDSAAAGGDERELAVLPEGSSWHDPAWSPDGLNMVVVSNPKPDTAQLFTVNLANRQTKLLTTRSWRKAEGISWLKDGSGVVFVAVETNSLYPQLWYVSFPGGDARPVISDLHNYGYATSLANDNSLLALQGINQSNIWVAPATNLSAAKQITFDSPGRNDGWGGLTWLADGRIVYTADDGVGTSIWIMNGDGTKSKQLIPSGGVNAYQSTTADGHTMVFHSNRSGHFAVWRSDLDGANMTQVTGDGTAAQPYISADGKYIIYISNYDGGGALWRMPTGGGEPTRLTEASAGWAEISPDSKMVVCQMNSKLAILSLETGEVLKSFDFPHMANPRLGIRWTADSKAVAYRDWINGIWKQELDGGPPKRLEGLPEEKLFGFGWSPDGKLFAYSRGATSRDIVLIKTQK